MSGLPSSWKRTQIGSICDVVRGSSPRPIADQRYFDGGTIPWIKIADATKSGRFLYDTREKVNEYGASFSRLLPKGSLIVAASGTLGYTQMLGVPGCIHDGWLHLNGFRGVEKLFLYYWLKCQVQHFTSSAYGAAIQNINTAIMRESVIDLPPLDDQFRIALTLSAYDDLIENNTRRISILEEMARRIYEEWFVRFRFPGHEGVRMVESELGLVPEGWQARLLGDEIELAYGKALKAEDRAQGEVPVYGSSGVVGHHSTPLVSGPGIIVGRKGNVGSVHWCDVPFFPIDTVFFVKTELPLHYVYFNLQRQNFLNNDAAVPGLNRNQAYALPLPVPSPEVLGSFEAQSVQLLGLARLLARKNVNLRATRDLLLPKLISGEMDVSALPEPEALAA